MIIQLFSGKTMKVSRYQSEAKPACAEFQRNGCGCPFPIPGTTQLDERFEKHQKKAVVREENSEWRTAGFLPSLHITFSFSSLVFIENTSFTLDLCLLRIILCSGSVPSFKKNQKTCSYIWNIWGI